MKKIRIDLTSRKFGRLTVEKYAFTKNNVAYWQCICECGNKKIIRANDLKSGRVKSCGCLLKEMRTKHGGTDSRLYRVWRSIKSRCYYPNHNNYRLYGARGIVMCEEWKENFLSFQNWALENGYDEKAKKWECTIDRIDYNGIYEPNNCRWVTIKEQQNNKRNNVYIDYKHERHSLAEWCRILKLSESAVRNRLNRNWSVERAFTEEIHKK